MERTDLLNAPTLDRAALALTDLHMRWERANKEFTDEMIEETARSWAISDEEIGSMSSFLCEFVMEMREESDEDFDN
jgi:hypothetical protein